MSADPNDTEVDAEYDGGFVVVNVVTNQVLEDITDAIREHRSVFDLQTAREYAAEVRTITGTPDTLVYRLTAVGPVGEDD